MDQFDSTVCDVTHEIRRDEVMERVTKLEATIKEVRFRKTRYSSSGKRQSAGCPCVKTLDTILKETIPRAESEDKSERPEDESPNKI